MIKLYETLHKIIIIYCRNNEHTIVFSKVDKVVKLTNIHTSYNNKIVLKKKKKLISNGAIWLTF